MTVAEQTSRGLRGLVRLACVWPLVTVVLSVLLAAAAVSYTLHALTFKTSGRDLLPPGQSYVERYTEYTREFGDLDNIAVVVEARNLTVAKAYASRLFNELKRSPDKFRRITYRIDPKQFEGRALMYLSREKLEQIRDRLFDYQEFLERFAARPTLDQLIDGINERVAAAFATSFFDLGLGGGSDSGDMSFLDGLLDQIGTRLERPAPYKSPWGSMFHVQSPDDAGYFLSEDNRLLFILVEPASTEGSFTNDKEAIESLRATIAALAKEFPGVNVGVTGAPALSNDEMTAAFRDSQIATYVAFGLTLGLLLVAFLRIGKPLAMLVVLAVSLCWSMGVATLVIGHLSLFSVMFIPIVIGIGIDYGIYFLFRYDEERFLGRGLRDALETTGERSGPGILMGALTAGGAFYVLMATDFRGIQELGFISGTAILLAFLAMMTLFPATIALIDRRRASRDTRTPRALRLERIHVPYIEKITTHPRLVIGAAALATTLALIGLRSLHFDYNLLNLQAEGTESVAWEKRILATAGRSGFTGLATAGSLQELQQKVAAFHKLPSVAEVDSVLLLIPSDQKEKQKIVKDFAPVVAPVRIGRAEPVDIDALGSALLALQRRFDIAVNEAPAGKARDDVTKLRDKVAGLLTRIGKSDREVAEPALNHLQYELHRDFVSSFHSLHRNLRPRQIQLKDIPDELRGKFIGKSGRFLIQIHPKVNIWDREGAETFVTDMRRVDPDVTGTPVITFEAIRFMEKGYKQGTVYAFALVAALAALILRRLRETALAMLPLMLGSLWTVGLMYCFSLPFNLGNVFGLPLILGAGAEFGLNVVLRYREGVEHGGPLIARSTVMAVLVNGLTTIVGFGSLMIADHRGIFGLGLLLTLGMVSTLTAALVVLPVLLNWLRFLSTEREPELEIAGPGV
jgi:hopanoid biosynthesis associated RND transporter like protein HpnN